MMMMMSSTVLHSESQLINVHEITFEDDDDDDDDQPDAGRDTDVDVSQRTFSEGLLFSSSENLIVHKMQFTTVRATRRNYGF